MVFHGCDARSLLCLALETYRGDILPRLGPDQRYLGAMIANALAIAARDPSGARIAEAERQLLEPIYGRAAGSLNELAADIRSGNVNPDSDADLADLLADYLAAELAIRNPAFLSSRSGPDAD